MALLSPPSYSTLDLHISRGSAGEMITEASDFSPGFRLGRVYDDACDEGLTLVSHRTDQPVVFALYQEYTDNEGDTLKWEFRSVTPGHRDMTLIVLND